MRLILKLEETAMFVLAYLVFTKLGLPNWWFWAFLLLPDIGMLGYLVNTKVGAVSYNFFHHKGIAVGLFIAGFYLASVDLQFAGIIMFAHASMDRVFGYGLKYPDSFQHTHLGYIGNRNI